MLRCVGNPGRHAGKLATRRDGDAIAIGSGARFAQGKERAAQQGAAAVDQEHIGARQRGRMCCVEVGGQMRQEKIRQPRIVGIEEYHERRVGRGEAIAESRDLPAIL